MTTAELLRIEQTETESLGVLKLAGRAMCLTLEPPPRGNAANVSCIPPGRYRCLRKTSPRFGETFEITGVPGRSHILFHAGNLAADTRGCVLLGSRFGNLGGQRAVLESKAALTAFLAELDRQESFELVIRELGNA